MKLSISKYIVPYIIDRLEKIYNYLDSKYISGSGLYIVHHILGKLKDICNLPNLSYILHLMYLVN